MDCKIISFAESVAKNHQDLQKKTLGDKSIYVEGLKEILTKISGLSSQFELENKDVLMDLLYLQITSELLTECKED